jgi:L-threonylcarbamoyladenylate synthase
MQPLTVLKLRRTLAVSGVIAYPTEAVFGLGCEPRDRDACERIFALKARDPDKGLILIGASFEHLQPYVAEASAADLARAHAQWPGPVTWLFPAAADCPRWITGRFSSVAVRVTAHPLAAELCRLHGGALISTSANRAGRPPARSALAVRRAFPRGVDLIVHGELGRSARPSMILDLQSGAQLRA